jgi:4-alpha-glucanotransferase
MKPATRDEGIGELWLFMIGAAYLGQNHTRDELLAMLDPDDAPRQDRELLIAISTHDKKPIAAWLAERGVTLEKSQTIYQAVAKKLQQVGLEQVIEQSILEIRNAKLLGAEGLVKLLRSKAAAIEKKAA